MAIVPTYFQNRIDAAELSRLLEEGEPFFLENVADVDATTAALAAELAGRDRTVRIDDNRASTARDTAVFLAPALFSLAYAAWAGGRSLVARLRNPRPDVVLVQRNGAVELRYERRGPARDAVQDSAS